MIIPLASGTRDRPAETAPADRGRSLSRLCSRRQPDHGDEKPGTCKSGSSADGKPLRKWRASRAGLQAMALSPDGKLLATGGDDRIVRLWEADTGNLVRELDGHTGEVTGVCFSPDSRSLAVAAGTMRLWRVTGERPILKSNDPVTRSGLHARWPHTADGRSTASYGHGTLTENQRRAGAQLPPERSCRRDHQRGRQTAADAGVDRDVCILAHRRLSSGAHPSRRPREGCCAGPVADGKLLALATPGHRIELWDLKENRPRLDVPRLPLFPELPVRATAGCSPWPAPTASLRLSNIATGRRASRTRIERRQPRPISLGENTGSSG